MRTVEGIEVGHRISSILAPGEAIRFAARPSYVTVRAGVHWSNATLLTTDRRLLVVRDRRFGRSKADLELQWEDVRTIEGALWKGGGPKIQLLIHLMRATQPVELIVDPEYAAKIETAVRTGYLDRRSS